MTTAQTETALTLAGTTLEALAISDHHRGYRTLYVIVVGECIVDAMLARDTRQLDDGCDWREVATFGSGVMPCECAYCVRGEDPAGWAADDTNSLAEALDGDIAEVIREAGYDAQATNAQCQPHSTELPTIDQRETTMTATHEMGTCIIPLTDARPVRIHEDQWPEIASASWRDYDTEHEFQSNRWWRLWIKVRQHADGRTLVYGVYSYETQFRHENGAEGRCGELLEAGGDVVAAIRRVGRDLGEIHEDAAKHERGVVRECIGKLPPQAI